MLTPRRGEVSRKFLTPLWTESSLDSKRWVCRCILENSASLHLGSVPKALKHAKQHEKPLKTSIQATGSAFSHPTQAELHEKALPEA